VINDVASFSEAENWQIVYGVFEFVEIQAVWFNSCAVCVELSSVVFAAVLTSC
jgi:hypothetical protein